MKVKEFMTATQLKYCSPETSLQQAAMSMKAGNCGSLPVVDNKNRVVGIITDRDIALTLAHEKAKPASQVKVEKIMSKKVKTVHEDEDFNTLLQKMRLNQIGRLPVVDDEGKLKGIVSVHNLLAQTQSVNGQLTLGSLNEEGENLHKTIQSINNRYTKRVLKHV
jgi:CBS domain-containing protein